MKMIVEEKYRNTAADYSEYWDSVACRVSVWRVWWLQVDSKGLSITF